MNAPRFSVVIPSLNEVRYIGALLDSALAQDYTGEVEVLVVDGQSSDGTREIIADYSQRHPGIRLIDNPERVTPIALNRGIEAATGSVVAICGAHAELTPAWVRLNVEALEAHPDAGCVGGIIENVNENAAAAVIGLAMASPFGVGNARFRTGGKAGWVDTVAFGAYRKAVFEEIGLFDTDLVRNQDDEFNFRLTQSGWKVWFDPQIISKYYVRGSYAKLRRQYYQYGYWKVYVNVKHRTITSWRQLVPFLWVTGTLLCVLLAVSWHPVFWAVASVAVTLWFIGALAFALRATQELAQTARVVRVFFILHAAYGWGYGRGLLRFTVMGRKPSASSATVTR